MQDMSFERFELFEEQVFRARDLFEAAEGDPRRPEMMAILQSAELTLKSAMECLGIHPDRSEPQRWWIEWQERNARL